MQTQAGLFKFTTVNAKNQIAVKFNPHLLTANTIFQGMLVSLEKHKHLLARPVSQMPLRECPSIT